MCLEESFCPFTRDALNFPQPKINAAPHRPAVCSGFPSPSTAITARCDALLNIPLYHSAPLPLKLKSAQIMRRQEMSMLVYLFLFAVTLLCCHMLWYSWSGQRWSNLLQWSAPRYSLLTFADNTALPGFLYFYTCSLNVSLHQIIISIHFPLIYAVWWALTYSAQSYLCMNGWQRLAFSFSTHTEARVTSQWGHKHTNNISRTARSHFMSVSLD